MKHTHTHTAPLERYVNVFLYLQRKQADDSFRQKMTSFLAKRKLELEKMGGASNYPKTEEEEKEVRTRKKKTSTETNDISACILILF